MKAYPTLAIIFPTYNGWKETKECLESIRKLNYPKNKLEIIIVDNGSTDKTVKMVTSQQRSVIRAKKAVRSPNPDYRSLVAKSRLPVTISLIRNQTNLGFAKAVNQGVRKTLSELILITNNDIAFEKNSLQELVKTLGSDPKIGAAGGKVCWKNQDKICFDGFRLNPYLAYHQFDLSGLNRKRECDWISGNCFLIRRKLFLDFGGLDEEYFFYFEDIDFCLKIKKAGFKLLYTPKAILFHGYGRTIFKEKTNKIFYLGYQSRWRCIFKNASLIQTLASSFFLLTLSPLYQSLLTRHNIFKPMFKGLMSNLKDYPALRRSII